MTEEKKVPYILLPETGRLSFPKMRELQYGQDDTEKKNGKYNFNLIFPADADLTELRNAIKAAASDKFGDRLKALAAKGSLKSPIKKGDTMVSESTNELYDGYEADSQVVSVNFYNPMPFLDQYGNRIQSNSPQAEATFYAGCYVQVAVTAHAYDQKGGTGVNLRCYALMKRAEGNKFGGEGFGDPDAVFANVPKAKMDVPAPSAKGVSEEEWA